LVVLLLAAFALAADENPIAPTAAGPTKVTAMHEDALRACSTGTSRAGTGRMADKEIPFHVHYTGWLTNGKKFDSSVGGQPFQFRIAPHQVIAGWEKGDGHESRRQAPATHPPNLAYGKEGYPGAIRERDPGF